MAGQRDITLDVTIRARTADADKAAAALKRVDEQAAHAGKSMEGMTGDANILNAEIKKSEQTVKDLDKVLLEFGNDKSVRQRLRSERSWLAELRKLEKDFSAASPATSGAGLTLPGGGGIMSLAAPAIGAALPALLPLGAMISGVVVGAVGGGGIVGGIAAAAHDSRVQSEWKDFTSTLTKESFGSESFVAPTIAGIETLKHGLADLHLDEVLGKGAPAVEKLAEGVVGFAKGVLPGLDAAMGRSDRAAGIMADGFTDIGSAFGEMIRDLAEKEGTMDGLQQTFVALTDAVKITHATIGFLTDGFEAMLGPSEAAARGLEGVYVWLPPLHSFFSRQADDIHEMRTETADLVPHLYKLTEAEVVATQGLDPFVLYLHHAWEEQQRLHDETEATRQGLLEYFKTLRGGLDADLAWEQAIDDLTQSVLENGNSLDIHTEKGRKNIRAVEDGLTAAQQQYEQGKLTSAQYDEQIQKLIDIGVKAGLSRKKLEELAGQYRIVLVVDAFVPAVKGAINLVSKAMTDLFSGGGGSGGTGRPGHESFAAGGVTPAFAPFRVHDNEMLWSSREHYVSTAAQTNALMSGASGGSASPVVISFAATGDPLLDAILRELKSYIQVNGGTGSDSVQTALGY